MSTPKKNPLGKMYHRQDQHLPTGVGSYVLRDSLREASYAVTLVQLQAVFGGMRIQMGLASETDRTNANLHPERFNATGEHLSRAMRKIEPTAFMMDPELALFRRRPTLRG